MLVDRSHDDDCNTSYHCQERSNIKPHINLRMSMMRLSTRPLLSSLSATSFPPDTEKSALNPKEHTAFTRTTSIFCNSFIDSQIYPTAKYCTVQCCSNCTISTCATQFYNKSTKDRNNTIWAHVDLKSKSQVLETNCMPFEANVLSCPSV